MTARVRGDGDGSEGDVVAEAGLTARMSRTMLKKKFAYINPVYVGCCKCIIIQVMRFHDNYLLNLLDG